MRSGRGHGGKLKRTRMWNTSTADETLHEINDHNVTSRVTPIADYALAMIVSCVAGVVFALLPAATVHATVQPQNCAGFPKEDGKHQLWSVALFALEKTSPNGDVSFEQMNDVWNEFFFAADLGVEGDTVADDGQTLLNTAGDVSSEPAGIHSITVNRFELTVGEYP